MNQIDRKNVPMWLQAAIDSQGLKWDSSLKIKIQGELPGVATRENLYPWAGPAEVTYIISDSEKIIYVRTYPPFS